MRFTKLKKYDKHVKDKLDIIVKEIKRSIRNLYAVILMGGYGKGEGAIEIINNEPRLYNDFDIYIITKKQIPDQKLEELGENCSKLIGAGGKEFPQYYNQEYDPNDFFHVDIRNLTLKKLKKLPPLVRYFELQRGSTTLFGQDVFERSNTIKESDLPIQEGLRLIMNRMMNLFLCFKPKFLKIKMNKNQKEIMNYYIAKNYLTCAEALLIVAEKYKTTYTERASTFSKIYKKEFPQLYKKIPDLDKKVIKFTDYKMLPDIKKVNSLKEWFLCRHAIGEVLKYCLSHYFKKEIPGDWLKISLFLEKNFNHHYYDPYASFILRKYGLDNKLIRGMLSYLARSYMNLRYFRNLGKMKFYLGDTGLDIFSATPLVLFSINKDGAENKEMLNEALKIVNKIYPTKNIVSWISVREDYLKAYKNYYLQRFI